MEEVRGKGKEERERENQGRRERESGKKRGNIKKHVWTWRVNCMCLKALRDYSEQESEFCKDLIHFGGMFFM